MDQIAADCIEICGFTPVIGSGVEAYQTSYHEHSWMKQLDLKIEDGFENISGTGLGTGLGTGTGDTPCQDLTVTH